MKQEDLPEEVKKALAAMKEVPSPDPIRQAAARQAFLARAGQLRLQAVSGRQDMRHRKQNILFRRERFPMTTLARALITLVLLSGLGTGTALAADASVPGQFLHPLDLTIENVQQALAFSPAARAQLSLRIAAERADELMALARSGQAIEQGDLLRLQTQLQTTLQDMSQLQQQDMLRLLTQLRDMAGDQAGQMEQLRLNEGAAIMEQFRQQAQNGIDDPAGFQEQHRHGAGWQSEAGTPEPEATETTEPAGEATQEPDATTTLEPARDQDRQQDRDRDQDQTCQPGSVNCPNVTPPAPGGPSGQGGGHGGGPGGNNNGNDD